MMKAKRKIRLICTISAALALVLGCTKTVSTAEQSALPQESFVLSASLDGDGQELQTRTSLGEQVDGKSQVLWKTGDRISGKVFYFFVTQLPTYGQDGGKGTSNTNMSGGVNAFASSKGGKYPQILVGDLNSAPGHSNEAGYNKLKTYWTDAYEAVSAAGNLASYYNTYSGTQSGTADTYQYSILQYTKNHPERRIDHIMTHGACTATSYRTVRNTYVFDPDSNTDDDEVVCAPSDHLPVVAYITLD